MWNHHITIENSNYSLHSEYFFGHSTRYHLKIGRTYKLNGAQAKSNGDRYCACNCTILTASIGDTDAAMLHRGQAPFQLVKL